MFTVLHLLSPIPRSDCNVTPAALRFGKNGYGKPQLLRKHGDGLSLPCLHFNVSHSSSLVACCVAMNSQVGIDVEERNRKLKHNVLSLARRFYSPDEVRFLEGLSEHELRRQEFIKLWTMKEAYVKALGRGFSAAPFRNFAIRLEVEEGKLTGSNASKITITAHCDDDILTTNWQFALVELSSHYATICVERTCDNGGEESEPFKLKIWKTVPFVDDECILQTY
ncbi:hypothetical protein HPP92_018147 [Vanilla planifolia]|uniref:holo-[acyl-carrier-protein] synthase n=1 Tax=Vanilla planifolia TaxID=51239 RepID=A0A835UM00_VANPL|nr:hypothetical protein HPP92_018147 [Vanilla planifolia]